MGTLRESTSQSSWGIRKHRHPRQTNGNYTKGPNGNNRTKKHSNRSKNSVDGLSNKEETGRTQSLCLGTSHQKQSHVSDRGHADRGNLTDPRDQKSNRRDPPAFQKVCTTGRASKRVLTENLSHQVKNRNPRVVCGLARAALRGQVSALPPPRQVPRPSAEPRFKKRATGDSQSGKSSHGVGTGPPLPGTEPLLPGTGQDPSQAPKPSPGQERAASACL